MSIHIGANKGDIAERILLCGDPLRAKYIAEHMLENVVCYTEVRNMLGYTGTYNGKKVSVQGTGMGQASLAIYVHELIHEYGVKQLIRVGTCGALIPELNLNHIIIAQGASSDSSANKLIFENGAYSPTADFDLLYRSYRYALEKGIKVRVADVFSTDFFYFKNDPNRWKVWTDHGVVCTDMETAMLYTMAAAEGVQALSILTVSDNIALGTAGSTADREKPLSDMVKLALGTL
ncbi:MAG: purine-nucleoside phosphorylase [Fulvivirga sp.]|nr:purine-nucleoside phosphorylase [Fulvivirga sp.]